MAEPEPPRTLGSTTDAAAYERAVRAELERRVAELAATSDEAFGRIGPGDAILVGVLFVLGPALVIWAGR